MHQIRPAVPFDNTAPRPLISDTTCTHILTHRWGQITIAVPLKEKKKHTTYSIS